MFFFNVLASNTNKHVHFDLWRCSKSSDIAISMRRQSRAAHVLFELEHGFVPKAKEERHIRN